MGSSRNKMALPLAFDLLQVAFKYSDQCVFEKDKLEAKSNRRIVLEFHMIDPSKVFPHERS